MEAFILTLHVIACVLLIVLVLLQSGKENMGVIFGGGSSSLFGSTGAGGLLTKLTAALATVFLITSLSYNYMTKPAKVMEESSIIDVQLEETTPAPAAEEQAK